MVKTYRFEYLFRELTLTIGHVKHHLSLHIFSS